jgi:tetratricopeptide (TPR) repeat protein
MCLVLYLAGRAQEAAPENFAADTAKVNQLIKESGQYHSVDFKKAVDLANEAMQLAAKINYPAGEGYALKSIGLANYYENQLLIALEYFQKSLNKFESIKDNVGIANLYNNIGVIYYGQGDDAKALENYLSSLHYSEMTGDKTRILTAANNVGGVYSEKKETWDKSLKYYLMALPLSEELKLNKYSGDISVNIGNIYFNKSLKAYGKLEGSLNAHNSIGKLYLKEKKFNEALNSHSQALTLAEKPGITCSSCNP